MEEERKIIPSIPGFFIIEIGIEGTVFKTPVIAWLLKIESPIKGDKDHGMWMTADPITTEMRREDSDFYLENPDGSFCQPGIAYFDDIDHLKREALKEQQEIKERIKLTNSGQ
jgi:hypothetical protein